MLDSLEDELELVAEDVPEADELCDEAGIDEEEPDRLSVR